jgi:hypothetical protein
MVQERPGSASADPAVCSDLPEILWRRGGRGGHDDHVPRPQAQPGQLGVEVVAWLARQACGERAVSCRRNQDSRDREVHDVVTASGTQLRRRWPDQTRSKPGTLIFTLLVADHRPGIRREKYPGRLAF